MYRASAYIEDDVLEALGEAVQTAPDRLRRGLGIIARGPVAQATIADLAAEPGSPDYPIRWKSVKQRRAFFVTDGFGEGIPTVRDHRLSQGWRIVLAGLADQYIFSVENSTPYTEFVQGMYQQPFHIDTGWPDANKVIRDHSDDFQEAVIDLWLNMAAQQ